MASQQNDVFLDNPKDGVTTYQNIRVERAADAGGVAGAFAVIATVAIDPSDEFTLYTDTGGEDSSWYRWRWQNTAATVVSNTSDPIQAGDSKVRQWLRGDLPDADITPAMLDRWFEQMLVELYKYGIWKPDRATITLTKAADQTYDEYYNVPGRIRDVIGVEAVSNDANLRHKNWLSSGKWQVHGRQIRFLGITDTYRYVIHGKAQYGSIGELTNDFFMLAYRIVKAFSRGYRQNQRANFYQHVLFDKSTDINNQDLRQLTNDILAEINEDVRALALDEPMVPARGAVAR